MVGGWWGDWRVADGETGGWLMGRLVGGLLDGGWPASIPRYSGTLALDVWASMLHSEYKAYPHPLCSAHSGKLAGWNRLLPELIGKDLLCCRALPHKR